MDQDFSTWKKSQLLEFLRARGKPHSGSKDHILGLCKLYANHPVINLEEPIPKCGLLSSNENSEAWKDFSPNSKLTVSIDMTDIISYLTTCSVTLECKGEKSKIDSGTKKPAKKGQQMYTSRKIQSLQTASIGEDLYFRCIIGASYNKEFRYPGVCFNEMGDILDAKCDCKANADGRCCHIAALLFCILDISMGNSPKLDEACTSKPCQWGKGVTVARKPKPVHLESYSKKRKTDAQYGWDPRPVELQTTTTAEVNALLQNLQFYQSNSMWEKVLDYQYDDYPLTDGRKAELLFSIRQLKMNLASDIARFDRDPKSTLTAVHLSGTENQAESDFWHSSRMLRITASNVKRFTSNPVSFVCDFWKTRNLDHIPAIQWGRSHEIEAINDFRKYSGLEIETCGLFVSRSMPFCGASPDGLVMKDGIVVGTVEIKCPYSMRNEEPQAIHSLTPKQRSSFPCKLVNGELELKRSHPYYYQCMFQMHVLGVDECYFAC